MKYKNSYQNNNTEYSKDIFYSMILNMMQEKEYISVILKFDVSTQTIFFEFRIQS
jgi:hypothetical protein